MFGFFVVYFLGKNVGWMSKRIIQAIEVRQVLRIPPYGHQITGEKCSFDLVPQFAEKHISGYPHINSHLIFCGKILPNRCEFTVEILKSYSVGE